MPNFYTETIQRHPKFNSVERVSDINLLEPKMRDLVQQIVADAAAAGQQLMVFETYRSPARQEELFRRKATKLRKVGVHHYGLACDIVKDIAGDPSWKGSFDFLGRLAKRHGLIWGGDWGEPDKPHKFVDSVHVQRCTVARQGRLFRGTWYPDDDYDPYEDLD
ncbi:MAG: M15 family metallopeptidase [Dongiaceae bacterium]